MSDMVSNNFDDIKDYYESYYKENEECSFPSDIKRLSTILDSIIKRSEKGMSFLDIGCGVGFACEILQNQGYRVHGIDISEEALSFAQKRLPEGTFTPATAEGGVPYEDESLDRLICLGVLEHIENPEMIISEAYRVLNRGAKALFSVPNSLNPYFSLAGGTGQIYEVPRRKKEWVNMFEKAGFKLIFTGKDPGPTIVSDHSFTKKVKVTLNKVINLLPNEFTYQFVFILEK